MVTVAPGSSSSRRAATASSFKRRAPPLATMTGSTTRLRSLYDATHPMISGLESMPVFTAVGCRSANTASIWARIMLTGSSRISVTVSVF